MESVLSFNIEKLYHNHLFTEYYNTTFLTLDEAIQSQEKLTDLTFKQLSLLNTFPVESQYDFIKKHLGIVHEFVQFGHTNSKQLDILSSLVGKGESFLHVTHHISFYHYWLNYLVNTNAIIWMAIKDDIAGDILEQYNVKIIMKEKDVEFHTLSIEPEPVYLTVYKLQFSPDFATVNHAIVSILDHKIPSHYKWVINHLGFHVVRIIELNNGRFLKGFINRFFLELDIHISDVLLKKLIKVFCLEDVMIISNEYASVNGICSIIKDISYGAHIVSSPDIKLIMYIIHNKYKKEEKERNRNISDKKTVDLTHLFFATLLFETVVGDLAYYNVEKFNQDHFKSREDFSMYLSNEYFEDMMITRDIYNDMQTVKFKECYSGEGWLSVLLSLYSYKFLSTVGIYFDISKVIEDVVSYSNRIIVRCNVLCDFLNSISDVSEIECHEKTYVIDDSGVNSLVYNDGEKDIFVRRAVYNRYPMNDKEEEDNELFRRAVMIKSNCFKFFNVKLAPEVVRCNQVLDTSFDVDDVFCYNPDLFKLATYFCYFPNRSFLDEVMYSGVKHCYPSYEGITYLLVTKFSRCSVSFSSRRIAVTIRESGRILCNVYGHYFDNNFHENLGGHEYVYSRGSLVVPMKLEEFIQHKTLGYLSPIDDYNFRVSKMLTSLLSLVRYYINYSDYIKLLGDTEHNLDSLHTIFNNKLHLVQSLPYRHKLTEFINKAFIHTGHVLLVRPLLIMSSERKASRTIKLASNAPFNSHHSLLTNNNKVQYVCRVCGNVGSTQYIVRICEFFGSMSFSSMESHERYLRCYGEQYYNYDTYVTSKFSVNDGNNVIFNNAAKVLRKLRGPTDLRVHDLEVFGEQYETSTFGVQDTPDVSTFRSVDEPVIHNLSVTDYSLFNVGKDFFHEGLYI